MRPDRRSWYGNGTQHERPPPPDGSALACALLVLERTDRAAAARARFISRRLMPPLGKGRSRKTDDDEVAVPPVTTGPVPAPGMPGAPAFGPSP